MNTRAVGLSLVLCLVVLLGGVGIDAQSQASRVDQIVARASRWVEEFFGKYSNVVAEERYVQDTSVPHRRRELKSDFLLVKPAGSNDWFQFRDVFEVDGKPVRDRDERLAKLFLQQPAGAIERASQVTRDSARYNLEDIGNLNMPLVAMSLLHSRYLPRFKFTLGKQEKKLGPDVWLVQFREVLTPTLLRSGQSNGDLPARGRLWIEEATGRVVKTELLIGLGNPPNQIETTFKFDEGLKMDVPVQMKEWYGSDTDQLNSVATYSRFRRFGVTTEETFR
jgi:hypothetical protein